MLKETIVLYDDGIALNMTLTRPDGNKKLPLCILIHGFTGHCEEEHILGIEAAMLKAKAAVLRADMYGHGKSGGLFREHTLFKWLGNIMTIIDYASALDFVSGLILSGHSQGGLAVMLAGAMKADMLEGLIVLSPAFRIPEAARNGRLLGRDFEPERIPDELWLSFDKTLSGNYLRVAQTIYVEKIAPRYKGPVLVVHGDADTTVPVKDGMDAAALYEKASLKIISGDTHCYDMHLDEVEETVTKWLVEIFDKEKEGRQDAEA